MTNKLRPESDVGALEAANTERERLVNSLHDRRGQDLFGFALRLGLSEADAADAVQETMLRLWRELCTDRAIVDADAWAFRTTYRLAVDQHRMRRRLAGLFSRLAFSSGRVETGAADPADASGAATVWQAVDRLPARQRAVLYLRYRADLPFDQIGLVLGITPNAARSHSTAALATLRRRLEREV